MAQAYDRLVTLLKASADVGSVLHKLILGSYESANDYVLYPDQSDIDLVNLSQVKQKGAVWRSELIPALLAGICTELDQAAGVWAHIDTKAVGVSPVIVRGFGVSSVTKDPIEGSLVINLSPGYANANWTPYVAMIGTEGVAVYSGVSASALSLRLIDMAGGGLGIDNHILRFMGMGGM